MKSKIVLSAVRCCNAARSLFRRRVRGDSGMTRGRKSEVRDQTAGSAGDDLRIDDQVMPVTDARGGQGLFFLQPGPRREAGSARRRLGAQGCRCLGRHRRPSRRNPLEVVRTAWILVARVRLLPRRRWVPRRRIPGRMERGPREAAGSTELEPGIKSRFRVFREALVHQDFRIPRRCKRLGGTRDPHGFTAWPKAIAGR